MGTEFALKDIAVTLGNKDLQYLGAWFRGCVAAREAGGSWCVRVRTSCPT